MARGAWAGPLLAVHQSSGGLGRTNEICHPRALKAEGLCESLLFGLPLVARPTTCWQLTWDELEANQQSFQALCHCLQVRWGAQGPRSSPRAPSQTPFPIKAAAARPGPQCNVQGSSSVSRGQFYCPATCCGQCLREGGVTPLSPKSLDNAAHVGLVLEMRAFDFLLQKREWLLLATSEPHGPPPTTYHALMPASDSSTLLLRAVAVRELILPCSFPLLPPDLPGAALNKIEASELSTWP